MAHMWISYVLTVIESTVEVCAPICHLMQMASVQTDPGSTIWPLECLLVPTPHSSSEVVVTRKKGKLCVAEREIASSCGIVTVKVSTAHGAVFNYTSPFKRMRYDVYFCPIYGMASTSAPF